MVSNIFFSPLFGATARLPSLHAEKKTIWGRNSPILTCAYFSKGVETQPPTFNAWCPGLAWKPLTPVNSSSRPLDPVTEVGRLVTAVPQLAALAIVASWREKLVGRWEGKSRIGVVGCLDFSMTFEGWRMKLTEKDVVANMVLILFMLWSEPFFGHVFLFAHSV